MNAKTDTIPASDVPQYSGQATAAWEGQLLDTHGWMTDENIRFSLYLTSHTLLYHVLPVGINACARACVRACKIGGSSTILVDAFVTAGTAGVHRPRHLVTLACCPRASATSTSISVSDTIIVRVRLQASPIPPHAGGSRAVFDCGVRRKYDV